MNDTEIINDRVSFFYSFFQFAETLKTTDLRCSFYDMVFRYAFFGEQPTPDNTFLYGTFLLIKPNIDVNIKNVKKGKTTGRGKENGNKEDKEFKEDKEMDIGIKDKGIRNKEEEKEDSQNRHLNRHLNRRLSDYPETIEDVIKLAENNCILFPKEEAERYLNYRQSSDWKKKTGQQITVGGIVSDMKLWQMRSKQFNADMQQTPDTSDDECISDEQYEAEMERKRNSRSPSMLEDKS